MANKSTYLSKILPAPLRELCPLNLTIVSQEQRTLRKFQR